MLEDAGVARQLADTKAADDVAALDRFYSVLNDQPESACYGFGHVQVAAEQQAVRLPPVERIKRCCLRLLYGC